MKRIYACLCIVAVLLGIAFYSSWRVQKFAEDISDDIDDAMEAIRDEDLPSARSAHGADHYSGDTSAFRQCVCGVEAACKASGAAGDLCAGTGASCR